MDNSKKSGSIRRFQYAPVSKCQETLPAQWSNDLKLKSSQNAQAGNFGVENVWSVRKNVDIGPRKQSNSQNTTYQTRKGYSRHETNDSKFKFGMQELSKSSSKPALIGSSATISQLDYKYRGKPSWNLQGADRSLERVKQSTGDHFQEPRPCRITSVHANDNFNETNPTQRLDPDSESPFDF